ncbi:helix-turn-helix transcriptional regulator [Amycolatopsis minnesotensis]|uniref:Helix-turn-helix transcriptional regulator n=1 Tax=Amycolatopsis minnesotensis TaxID=337894 RepID=A0ABN2RDU8_9PSEU
MSGSTRTSAALNLGERLRKAREAQGVSLRKLAEAMGEKPSYSGVISRWETGDRLAKAEDVAKIVEALKLGSDEAAELTEFASASAAGSKSSWLAITLPERRQQLNALLAAEATATKVTHVAPLLIPGVLQTADVIRAIMVDGGVPGDEIDERVYMRLGRRDLITRKNAAHLEVLLEEAAIRRTIGSPGTQVDQLRYLLELGELPNVDIRIVSYSAGWTPAAIGSFILLESDQAPPLVSLDMAGSGLMLHDRDDIAAYRRAAAEVREKAMSPADTAVFIARVITELEDQE